MANTSRRVCSLPSRLSSEKANSSWGNSSELSEDNSTRTARACGSFAQHSGGLVFMFLFQLTATVTKAGFFQAHKIVGCPPAKAEQIAVQLLPGSFSGSW